MWFNQLFRSAKCRPSRAPLARPRARLSVETLEDRLTPAAMLTIANAQVLEGNDGAQNALVTVRLTEPHGNNVTVNYATVAGTATAGSDYTAVAGKLTFAKNEMSKSIVVPIRGDRLVESDESFSVHLSDAKGAKIANGTGQVTIVDDEPYVWVGYANVTEANDDPVPAVFSVNLTSIYDRPVTIHYATANGSATAGLDYTDTEGSLTIPAGLTSGEIVVPVLGDRLGEPNETFVLNVSTSDSYARMGNDTAIATIVDNEPQISIGDAYLEGSTITFTVTLSAPYDQPVSVSFTTMNGTAIAGVDYVGASGPLTFELGQTSMTITIDVLDTTGDASKYFSVHLSDATTNALIATESAYGYWFYDPGYGYWYGGGDYYLYGY
jgi:hypothetical protein